MNVCVTTEGLTEERFVKRVLAPHLSQFGVWAEPRSVLTSKKNRLARQFRGGFRLSNAYTTVRRDIGNWMLERKSPDVRFTTMFDLYALPADFPGSDKAGTILDPYARVAHLEQALQLDIADSRFLPYIQLHEFETLLFADPRAMDWEYLEHETAIASLAAIANSMNPELIDDGPTTAPSKRIELAIPEYDKPNAGPLILERVGIAKLKQRCRHFREWVNSLEALGECR